MSYTVRQIGNFTRSSVGAYAAGQDVASWIVPANREVEIYNLRAFNQTPGAANAHMNLTDSIGNVLAQVSLTGSINGVAESAQTATTPVRYTFSPGYWGNDTIMRLKMGNAEWQWIGSVQVDFSYPGAK